MIVSDIILRCLYFTLFFVLKSKTPSRGRGGFSLDAAALAVTDARTSIPSLIPASSKALSLPAMPSSSPSTPNRASSAHQQVAVSTTSTSLTCACASSSSSSSPPRPSPPRVKICQYDDHVGGSETVATKSAKTRFASPASSSRSSCKSSRTNLTYRSSVLSSSDSDAATSLTYETENSTPASGNVEFLLSGDEADDSRINPTGRRSKTKKRGLQVRPFLPVGGEDEWQPERHQVGTSDGEPADEKRLSFQRRADEDRVLAGIGGPLPEAPDVEPVVPQRCFSWNSWKCCFSSTRMEEQRRIDEQIQLEVEDSARMEKNCACVVSIKDFLEKGTLSLFRRKKG